MIDVVVRHNAHRSEGVADYKWKTSLLNKVDAFCLVRLN
jgi:hypothetical protein